jgi:hypothetical protein
LDTTKKICPIPIHVFQADNPDANALAVGPGMSKVMHASGNCHAQMTGNILP